MRDYISLGSTPSAEECAQVGSENYSARARAECRVFIEQLRREFGAEPEGCQFGVKGFEHDFGRYYEVVCYYEYNGSDTMINYAFGCENASEGWDKEARAELKRYGHLE